MMLYFQKHHHHHHHQVNNDSVRTVPLPATNSNYILLSSPPTLPPPPSPSSSAAAAAALSSSSQPSQYRQKWPCEKGTPVQPGSSKIKWWWRLLALNHHHHLHQHVRTLHPYQIKAPRREWCISSMIYSRDTPFWSGTLEMYVSQSSDALCQQHSHPGPDD